MAAQCGWLALHRSVYFLFISPFSVKQQNLEQRQADVEYELRCLLNKPGEPAQLHEPALQTEK